MGHESNRRPARPRSTADTDGGRSRFVAALGLGPRSFAIDASRSLPRSAALRLCAAAIQLCAAALLAGCLTDETLRIECRNDQECRGVGRCIDRVCTTGNAVRSCGPNQTLCGEECVDTERSSAHCGRCFEPCVAGPEQSATCIESVCQRACSDGFYDVDPDTAGCEYRCDPTSPSTEVCDGVDNDCDGRVDASDDDLSTPRCPNQIGVCDGARRECADGALRDCDPGTYERFAGGDWQAVELVCDQVDNDCDGNIDEHCCRINEEPYALIPIDGPSWAPAVLGILPGADGPELVLVDTDQSELRTYALGRTAGANLVDTEPIAICPAFMITDAIFASGRRQVVATCSEARSAVSASPLELVAPRGYLRTEIGTYVRAMDASAAGAVLYVVAELVDPDGARSTTVIVDRGDEFDVTDYEPPIPSIEAVSVAADADGADLVFAARDDGTVWLQRVDTAGHAVSFARPIVEGEDWFDVEDRLATDVLRMGEDLLVAHPGADGVLTLTRVDSEGQPTPLTAFAGVRATRVSLRDRRPEPTALFALTTEGLRAWTLDPSGDAIRSWSLPLHTTTRQDIAGTLPARVAAHTDGDVLYVAYASPSDVGGERFGVFVHRLGPDSEPLCH